MQILIGLGLAVMVFGLILLGSGLVNEADDQIDWGMRIVCWGAGVALVGWAGLMFF